jgi:hypothetical protein
LTPKQTAQWDKTLSPVVSAWEGKDPRNKALLEAMRKELAASRAGN